MGEKRQEHTIHAEVVEVIKVNSIVGLGNEESPMRTVVNYYTKNGLHLVEIDNLTEPEYIDLEEL